MKYETPMLYSLGSGGGAPICWSGTSADSSGCDDGSSVAGWCALGSGDEACADGSSAGLCGVGTGGGGAPCYAGSAAGAYTRCITGTVVS